MNNEQQDKILMEIHTTVTTLAAEAKEDRARLSEVRTVVFGNGKPGIFLDVDRLKVFKTVCCWFLAILTAGSITVFGKLIYDAVKTV